MRLLLALLLALLLRLLDPHPPARRPAPAPGAPARREDPDRPAQAPGPPAPPSRTRPYVPIPAPRIPEEHRVGFYELAEYSRHSSLWEFTYNAGASAPYCARHRVEPDLVVGASTPDALSEVLNDIVIPAYRRPYEQGGRSYAAAAAGFVTDQRAARTPTARAER